jgi:hypothetical protein
LGSPFGLRTERGGLLGLNGFEANNLRDKSLKKSMESAKEISAKVEKDRLEEVLEFYRIDLCHEDRSHYDPELIFTDMGKDKYSLKRSDKGKRK